MTTQRSDSIHVRWLCGAWHPTLRQVWGSPPSCKLDKGHAGSHYAISVGPDGRQAVAW